MNATYINEEAEILEGYVTFLAQVAGRGSRPQMQFCLTLGALLSITSLNWWRIGK